MWGTDHAASVELSGLARLVAQIRDVERAVGDGVKRVYPSEEAIKRKLRRVFAVHKYLSSPTKGSVPGDSMVPLRTNTPGENARRRSGQRPAGGEAPLRGLSHNGSGPRFRLVPRPASN